MKIQVGDRIPSATLKHMGTDGPLDVRNITTDNLCRGKKVVLFGLPGAYTPVCDAEHLPGFIENAGSIRAKGADCIACISGNDPFVMKAWGDAQNAGDDIMMLSDYQLEFTKTMGLTLDLFDFGLGIRSERYSMVVEDGVISELQIEESILSCGASSGKAVLAALR